ncbi:DNA-protecting protein DprA [Mitsuaria sp. WAJ17]|uniref:DNA-processing protein DprA n=1 Tax=Mitsuaria sp. WAJ17 TaxID=2761452 RepID=UPI0016008BEC|nr:DNA-processing protein DprA [Mitsuaria sp. WAJ17]MBB2485281.1 DNA-protecting protein DprA [Mitsuaria sp. WAJ17]
MPAPPRDPGELSAWLRLVETPGLGRSSLRRLLTAFGEPRAIFQRSPADWSQVVGTQGALALGRPPEHLEALLERTRLWLKEDRRRSLLLLGDPDYPPALLETADPPLLMYLWGQRELLRRPMLAIVGSRNASPQGLDNALTFSRSFSESAYCVVSGLALGIDAAAHEGALSAAGGTLAVLGTGLNQLYPRRNAGLAMRIVEHGLLMSEYALDTPALAPHFPVRNRIIAGLSEGCLVVEAALQSGSLITARLAGEAGREVFAIPGSIHSPLSRGCHALIRQGAKLVESPSDVIEELPRHSSMPRDEPAADTALPDLAGASEHQRLLAVMAQEPVSLDALQARGGWPTEQLQALLLDLELDGLVARLPGGLLQRRMRG